MRKAEPRRLFYSRSQEKAQASENIARWVSQQARVSRQDRPNWQGVVVTATGQTARKCVCQNLKSPPKNAQICSNKKKRMKKKKKERTCSRRKSAQVSAGREGSRASFFKKLTYFIGSFYGWIYAHNVSPFFSRLLARRPRTCTRTACVRRRFLLGARRWLAWRRRRARSQARRYQRHPPSRLPLSSIPRFPGRAWRRRSPRTGWRSTAWALRCQTLKRGRTSLSQPAGRRARAL